MVLRKALKIQKAQKEYKRSKRAARMQPELVVIDKPIVNKKPNNAVYIVSFLLVGSIFAAILLKSNKK
jgi:hypothetical protein